MTSVRAGDFDYEAHGSGYSQLRRTDPRICALVHAALGDARSVLNVGAGAGSYEPTDRTVVAVEPSASMRSQRSRHLVPAIAGRAELLPFDNGAFDASMATITVHQWEDTDAGLREMRRVTRGPVVIMTFDGDLLGRLWLDEYAPELLDIDRSRYPSIDRIAGVLGGSTSVTPVPIPIDCVDGFAEAFYARPEAFLDPAVRGSQSGWGFLDPEITDRVVARLHDDLESGAWDRAYGHWRSEPEFTGALRLVVARPVG